MICRNPPARTHPLFGMAAVKSAATRTIRFAYFPRLGILSFLRCRCVTVTSGMAIVTAGGTNPQQVLIYRVLKDADFDGFPDFAGRACESVYQFFGFRNHHQRSVRESKLRSQWPSDHSSVTFRQFRGTCG